MALRVALLGCGRIAGFFHGPILGAMREVSVVAVAEREAEARDRVGNHTPGAVRFDDWRRALDTPELDAAVICLPPKLHAPAAIAAFERDLHVYVEKPLALNLVEADKMIEAQRRTRRVGMVGLNFRFHPLVEDARTQIGRGALGRLLAVRTLFASARRALPAWKAEAGAGGGVIADLATHHFDAVPWVAGERFDPASIAAVENRGADGGVARITGALESGALVEILASQTTGASANVMQFLGEKGHLTVDLADPAPRSIEKPPGRFARVVRLRDALRPLSPRALLRRPGGDPSFARALRAFVEAAQAGAAAAPALSDGRDVLALVAAAERSAVGAGPLREAG